MPCGLDAIRITRFAEAVVMEQLCSSCHALGKIQSNQSTNLRQPLPNTALVNCGGTPGTLS
jgi:hypothetical protein